MNWHKILFGLTKRIDEVGYKIFFFSTFFKSLLFVFDDDFVVGDFDDFLARNGEFGIDKSANLPEALGYLTEAVCCCVMGTAAWQIAMKN